MVNTNRIKRALQIRHAALEVIRAQGTMSEVQGLPGRSAEANLGTLQMGYRTPFQRLPASSASVKYARALIAQRGHKVSRNLDYGLDVWNAGRKVLNLEWSLDDREVQIVSFKRGPWEEILLGSG